MVAVCQRGEAMTEIERQKETELFLKKCILLLDEEYIVKYDERYWEE